MRQYNLLGRGNQLSLTLIGVNGVDLFLGEAGGGPEAMLRHIDYIAEKAGPQHVGLGLDYSYEAGDGSDLTEAKDPDYWWPPGHGYDFSTIHFTAPETIPELADRLAALPARIAFADGAVVVVGAGAVGDVASRYVESLGGAVAGVQADADAAAFAATEHPREHPLEALVDGVERLAEPVGVDVEWHTTTRSRGRIYLCPFAGPSARSFCR